MMMEEISIFQVNTLENVVVRPCISRWVIGYAGLFQCVREMMIFPFSAQDIVMRTSLPPCCYRDLFVYAPSRDERISTVNRAHAVRTTTPPKEPWCHETFASDSGDIPVMISLCVLSDESCRPDQGQRSIEIDVLSSCWCFAPYDHISRVRGGVVDS